MKVLLVDDDRLIREDIKTFFDWEKEGFDIVAEVSDGKEAFQSANIFEPDIILTDISMPNMNGVDLIKQLKMSGFQGECIVMSNYDDFDFVKDAMKYGAFDYCLKYKITPDSLLELLKSAKKQIIEKNSGLKPDTWQQADYFRALINGEKAPFDSNIENCEYCFIYLRYSPNSDIRMEKRMLCSGDLCVRITENEDVLVIKRTPGSLYEETALLHKRAMNYAQMFPEVIISYSSAAVKAKEIRGKVVELWKNADRHFYSGRNVIHSDASFEFTSALSLEKRNEFEEKILNAVLGNGAKNSPIILDEVFHYFSEHSIRPKTVYIFFEDVIFKIKNIVDPVRVISLTSFPQDREIVRYITANQLKQTIKEWIELNFGQFNGIGKPEVVQALYFINANYMQKLTLQQVADYVCVSRNHFCTIFHQETGEGFVAYLQKVRMEKAKKLLNEGKYRVQEVAYMVGIDNARYFCKTFHEYTGVLPSEYKEKET